MRSWVLAAPVYLAACQIHPDYANTHYRCDSDGKCPAGYTCVAGACEIPSNPPNDGTIDAEIDAYVPSGLVWWDPSFGKRARITITNGAPTTLGTGFPVGVSVTLANLDSPSALWDALRVVRYTPGTGWVEKTRYLEGVSGTRLAWFTLDASLAPGNTNTEYWLYFNNPAPTVAPGNGNVVFDFYDAFSGSAVGGGWSVQGTPTVANNDLTLHPNDSVRTNMQFAPGHAVALSMSASPTAPRYWVGFQRQSDFTDDEPWLIWISRTTTDSLSPPGVVAGTIWPETLASSIGLSSIDYGSPAVALDGQKRYFTVQRLTDRVVFKYEEQVVYQLALPASYTDTLQVRLANEGTANVVFGSAHVRQAVWPDPMLAIGPTETPP